MPFGHNDNLPPWPGAAECYERGRRIMRGMAENGHMRLDKYRTQNPRGRFVNATCVSPSDELRDFARTLLRGDEGEIRALLHEYRRYDPQQPQLERVT